jgi:hypothetical protein
VPRNWGLRDTLEENHVSMTRMFFQRHKHKIQFHHRKQSRLLSVKCKKTFYQSRNVLNPRLTIWFENKLTVPAIKSNEIKGSHHWQIQWITARDDKV